MMSSAKIPNKKLLHHCQLIGHAPPGDVYSIHNFDPFPTCYSVESCMNFQYQTCDFPIHVPVNLSTHLQSPLPIELSKSSCSFQTKFGYKQNISVIPCIVNIHHHDIEARNIILLHFIQPSRSNHFGGRGQCEFVSPWIIGHSLQVGHLGKLKSHRLHFPELCAKWTRSESSDLRLSTMWGLTGNVSERHVYHITT